MRNADGVRNLRKIIDDEQNLFIIVSAMGKTTNALEKVFEGLQKGDKQLSLEHVESLRKYHAEIIDELWHEPKRLPAVDALFGELEKVATETVYKPGDAELWYDTIVAYGELVSTTIISEYLNYAGVIGIINSWGIIKGAVGLAANELKGKGDAVESNTIRTQKDLSMKVITIGIIVSLIVTFLFFQFGVLHNWFHAAIGLLLVGVIAFLFTTVAANAIAIVGTNPVSGMTLMTLILASIILVAVGLKGPAGMVSALIIGGVVCTALSMAGGFITDLKIGYWLGSTPAKQETWKFLGTLVSAATVGGVILILNQTYGFTTGQLAAPQANAMAAVIEPLMSGSGAPWALYAIGAVLAVVLNFCKIPALAFALGMFIPLDLNTPLLIGGAISWYVGSRSKDQSLNSARLEKGTLLASGFIAGGALMGVVSAALRFGGINLMNEEWASSNAAEILAVVMYLVMIAYLTFNSLNAKKE